MMRIIYLLLAFAVSLFAFAPSASPVDDRAGFFSEKERATFEEFTRELYSRTGFSLYLFTADKEIAQVKSLADSLCESGATEDSLRAVIVIDGSTHSRAFAISPAAKKFLSDETAERLLQKFLLPEFRKDRYGYGILVFSAEIAKYIARLNDVRLTTPLPRPSKDGIPPIAWFLIFAVVASVVIAYAYFVRQSKRAKRRERSRDFGGFPHSRFDSGFGR